MEDIIVEDLEITIQGDDEGYITFECPFCKSEFKLRADECQNDETPYDEYFCPYCGLVKDKNEFLSEDIIEQVKAIAMNELIEELNKSFSNMKNSINKSKYIKMEYKPLEKVNIKDLKENETVEEVLERPTCGNHEKVLYCSGVSKIFCAYCGVDI